MKGEQSQGQADLPSEGVPHLVPSLVPNGLASDIGRTRLVNLDLDHIGFIDNNHWAKKISECKCKFCKIGFSRWNLDLPDSIVVAAFCTNCHFWIVFKGSSSQSALQQSIPWMWSEHETRARSVLSTKAYQIKLVVYPSRFSSHGHLKQQNWVHVWEQKICRVRATPANVGRGSFPRTELDPTNMISIISSFGLIQFFTSPRHQLMVSTATLHLDAILR